MSITITKGNDMQNDREQNINVASNPGLALVPFMDRQRFCSLVGITPNVLAVWVREGRVKTVSMGKRSLIDLREWWLQ